MPKVAVRAVLLDMGGVLLDMRGSNGLPPGPLDHRGRQALLRRLAPSRRFSTEDLARLVFDPWRRAWADRYRTGREADLAAPLAALRRETGSELSDLELLETWFEPYAETLAPIDGAVEAVRSLRRAGSRLAVISNVPLPGALYRRILDERGFAGLFDAYRFSYDTGHRKPSPFMLRSALRELGADAAQAVMVGDRKQSDVLAGRAAGVGTVWIRSEYDRGPEPDWTLPSLAALPALLEREEAR